MASGTQLKQHLEGLTPGLTSQVASENFSQIQLDEQETAEALRKGREEKYYLLKRIEYNKKLNADLIPKNYTAAQLIGFFGERYIIDDSNRNIVLELCRYFANDDLFDGNLSKGLLVVGGVGLGKSTLMEFFKKNQRQSYRLISCRDLEVDYSHDGETTLQHYSYNLDIARNSDPFGHQTIGYCFDDLGTEANGKYYGKERNVMAELILNRYDNQLPYVSTHITTNTSAANLIEQYGERVADRMREMFNIIEFPITAKSRRG